MDKLDKIDDEKSKKLMSWHPQQEKILKNWSEIGSSYRYLHDKSFTKYDYCNMAFSLPVIILSTLTGVANFAQSSFPVDSRPAVAVIVGSLNIIAGLITTIAQFLKVAEKMEGHRAASVSYSKFSRNISVELSLPVKERLVNGTEFLSVKRAELDRLIEQSPSIPEDILKKFDKTFIKRDPSGNKIEDDTTFYKPEILDIKPVQIYEKTTEEKAEEEKLKRINEMKWNKKLKDMIIEDDNKRRGEIYEDVMKQMKHTKDLQQVKPPPPKDTSAPDAIALEMTNIMQELNMNELNTLGYDIENNELNDDVSITVGVEEKSEPSVEITEEVVEEKSEPVFEEEIFEPVVEENPEPVIEVVEKTPEPVIEDGEKTPEPVIEDSEKTPEPAIEVGEETPEPVIEVVEEKSEPVIEVGEDPNDGEIISNIEKNITDTFTDISDNFTDLSNNDLSRNNLILGKIDLE